MLRKHLERKGNMEETENDKIERLVIKAIEIAPTKDEWNGAFIGLCILEAQAGSTLELKKIVKHLDNIDTRLLGLA